ncbi:MAG TPA: sulfite exporter TauE/SafE family protein [Saprospiraceae bacterium]|nr:sulfite exporter TauE/SafE family protein [Saprospiraceae bacterium]
MIAYLVLFFVVATIYASQKLGGIPTLIALLVLLPFTAYETKILALVLTTVVILLMLIQSVHVPLSRLVDAALVLIAAIPFVILGAGISIADNVFFFLFGCAFLLSSLFMFIEFKSDGRKRMHKGGLIVGAAAIGFFTGLTGMVGSILLLPILQIYNWKEKDEIVLFSSVFVLITSFLAIFVTYKSGSSFNIKMISFYSLAVIFGNFVGRRIEITYLNPHILRNVTALFLLGFGVVLMYNYGSTVLKLIDI